MNEQEKLINHLTELNDELQSIIEKISKLVFLVTRSKDPKNRARDAEDAINRIERILFNK